jgi:hypothetical protein
LGNAEPERWSGDTSALPGAMTDLSNLGKFIILAGVILLVLGLLFLLLGRVPLIGRLPGDFVIRRDGTTIYIPLATMILLSLLLTIIVNLIFRR